MNNAFDPKIDILEGMTPPDIWPSSNRLIPDNNFVVSRSHNGKTVSRYGDVKWDMTPYNQRNDKTTFDFTSWCRAPLSEKQQELAFEMRYLMFLLIWKRPPPNLAPHSLKSYMTLLRGIAKHANNRSFKIIEILSQREILLEYISLPISKNHVALLRSLLQLLLQLGEIEIGFKPLGSECSVWLSRAKRNADLPRQYPPIPTRIYSQILSGLKDELDEWSRVEKNYLKLFSECFKNPLLGRNKTEQITIAKAKGLSRTPGEYYPEFRDLIATYELENYFRTRELKHSVKGLQNGLTFIREIAAVYVIAYSGMRRNEAWHLPFDCLTEDLDTSGGRHHIIRGRTTKTKRGETKWVTNSEGARAIKICQRIAISIYEQFGNALPTHNSNRNSLPLLVSFKPETFDPTPDRIHKFQYKVAQFNKSPQALEFLKERYHTRIQLSDIEELEHIDPHRNWRNEDDFKVGRPWRLTNHQLRRSLALYAQRSGMVSLPSLRRQLQHLTNEMSRYYARGSLFATNFIGDDQDHFGLEWQETAQLSSGLAYLRDMFFSTTRLFGGHVKWLDHRLKTQDGHSLMDRATTLKRFKNGELSYKETPLGGCTKVGPCKDSGLRFIDVECLSGCENLVIKLPKLDRVIAGQQALVSQLDPTTIAWRMESTDLNALVAARDRFLGQKREGPSHE